ncbi:MAG: hypothetical protein FWG08_04920 [Propionibacteriaceae bacterium]|jgi:type II secretory pathway component PulF|nr:hypothetical protein [Propionibacteriaceae bacterium]
MKKLLYVLLIVAGLGFAAYVVSQKQSEARRLWDEALSKVPSPGCDCCVQED